MKVKKMFCLGLILYTFILGGCWDHTDVDELSMVVGMGIDKIPGKEPIKLSLQIVNPNAEKTGTGGGSSSSTEKAIIVESTKGKSIFEAIHNFAKISPKRLLLSHNKVIILGKSFAESNVNEIADYLSRDREIRKTSWIFVTEGNAKDVLDTKLDLAKIPAKGLENMITNSGSLNLTYPVNQNEFFYRLDNVALTSFAPVIELENCNDTNKQQQQDMAGKSTGDSGTEAEKKIVLGNKTAIFKNNKMVGIIDNNESRGLFLLNGHIKGETVVIPPQSKMESQEITIDVFKGGTKIIPRITNDGITMKIVCKVEAGLREAENINIDINELDKYNKIKVELEKILKARIEGIINTAQKKLGSDFINFATQIHNNHPYVWKQIRNDWNQVFPNIKYEVTVDATIVRSGLTKDTNKETMRKGLMQ